ncbi:MAG: HNH endonuclease, partial [Metamycoplasmataceae bacterium]
EYLDSLGNRNDALLYFYDIKLILNEKEKVIKEIGEIKNNNNLSPTEKETILMARIGQGKYRRQLLKINDSKCVVSGVDIEELLIASHIVPWSEADNKTRVDPYNGIPLLASIDKLFDKKWISFDEEGKLVVSKTFKKNHNYKEVMATIGIYKDFIVQNKAIKLQDKTKEYMRIHFQAMEK